MPWPTTPRWAQRRAPMASPPGLEHQATLAAHGQGPAPAHTPSRLHTGRRYLPPTCASVGSGGCRQSARPWNRTVRQFSPVVGQGRTPTPEGLLLHEAASPTQPNPPPPPARC